MLFDKLKAKRQAQSGKPKERKSDPCVVTGWTFDGTPLLVRVSALKDRADTLSRIFADDDIPQWEENVLRRAFADIEDDLDEGFQR